MKLAVTKNIPFQRYFIDAESSSPVKKNIQTSCSPKSKTNDLPHSYQRAWQGILRQHQCSMQNIGKINIKEQKKFNNKLPDLLQSFQIISELHVKSIWDNLWVPTILVVFFSVEKPVWDLELTGIGHDGHEVLKLCSRKLTSPKIGIQIPQVCEITVTHQIS